MATAKDDRIGHDIIGQPIYVGSRVAWGVKGYLRLGSVVERHHTYDGRTRKGVQIVQHYIRVTTLSEDKPQGRGGVFLETSLLVVPFKQET